MAGLPGVDELFEGRYFDGEIIVLCLRWYLRSKGGDDGRARRVDENYDGKTVDFRLSARRDVTAAKAFFCNAIKVQGAPPRTITLDGYAGSHPAVRDMQPGGQLPANTKLRSSKYLDNLIEQDHRGVKLRIGPMLGWFKRFETAVITISGVELLRRIHKGQSNLRRLRFKGRSAPTIWNAVLAAR